MGEIPFESFGALFFSHIASHWQRTLYRVTSLTRNRTTLGPYSRPMARVLWGSWGDGRFLMSEEIL